MGGPDAYTRATMGNFYFIVSRRFVCSDYLFAFIFMLDILLFHARGDLLISIQSVYP
jgi:hypothetical protein